MADHDEDQDELSEQPQRLFTLTEAERTRRELEPFLIEAISARKRLSAMEQEFAAVSTRILMMGGVLVPYAKLAEKRLEHQGLAGIFPRSSITRRFICAGNWAKTASATITARMKAIPAASRSIPATSAPATKCNSRTSRLRAIPVVAGL